MNPVTALDNKMGSSKPIHPWEVSLMQTGGQLFDWCRVVTCSSCRRGASLHTTARTVPYRMLIIIIIIIMGAVRIRSMYSVCSTDPYRTAVHYCIDTHATGGGLELTGPASRGKLPHQWSLVSGASEGASSSLLLTDKRLITSEIYRVAPYLTCRPAAAALPPCRPTALPVCLRLLCTPNSAAM